MLANHKRPNPKDKGIGPWDIGSVRNLRGVRKQDEPEWKSITAELSSFVRSNHEMPDGNVSKIFKGRDVLLGDNVRDEESHWAVFSDLGLSPPTLEVCRNFVALSRLPDYETWTGDANGAYCQLYFENEDGIVTWVTLLEHRWPKEWKGTYDQPVVILVLALHGHPKAGKLWENDCTSRVEGCDCEAMRESWPNVFCQPKIMAFLLGYVDDFRLVAKGERKQGL